MMFCVLLDVLPIWGIRNPVSMLSHLLGGVLSVVGLLVLVRTARRHGLGRRGVFRLVGYGVSMVFVFTASVLFHFFPWPPEALVPFKKLDHAAIFILIAGSTSAIYGTIQMRWAARLSVLVWGLALAGLVLKLLIWPMPLWLTALTYLVVGWVAAAGSFALVRVAGWRRLRPLLAGMLVLTGGAYVFAAEWPVLWPGIVEGHELFHLLVLAGLACQYHFIVQYATRPDAYAADAQFRRGSSGKLARRAYSPPIRRSTVFQSRSGASEKTTSASA